MSTPSIDLNTSGNRAVRDELEIRIIVDSIHKAHHDKDAAAIAAPYLPDAAVFNLAPPLMHTGVDVEEKRRWLASWSTPIELESRDVEITISGDLALWNGFLRLQGTKIGPEGTVDFWMRETLCFKRQGGSWRIVHEHTSVPFYMDGSLRPAFDLKP